MKKFDWKQLILDCVREEQGKPVPAGIIVKKILKKHPKMKSQDLYRHIDFLIKDDFLRKNYRGFIVLGYEDVPMDKTTVKVGILSLNEQGNGFITETLPDESTQSYYVHKRNVNGALNRDRVLFCKLIKEPKNDLYDAQIIEVLDRNKKFFVGTYQDQNVILDDYKVYQTVKLTNSENLVDGHKILIEANQITPKQITGTVIKVLGHKDDVGTDILSIITENGVHYEIPEHIEAAANQLKFQITEHDKNVRRDIRQRTIFSVDPATSKDMDDAVYVKKLDDHHYFLGVSIADVATYVQPNTPLDEFAFQRGTSVYLADRVIPMLPHYLANDLCSLNPNVERMAITCDMVINQNGEITKIDLYPSIMVNHHRLSYDFVNQFFAGEVDVENHLAEMLTNAKELHTILRKKKHQDGYVDFEIAEPEIVLDDQGKPIAIELKKQGIAQRMIEDFMIAANEAVTMVANEQQIPFIYRIHKKPDQQKLNNFLIEAKKLLLEIDPVSAEEIEPKRISAWVDANQTSPNKFLLNKLLLRTMQKANYSTENLGHFGLASENYTHFTSPIRRYSDLIVHRLFWMFLFDRNSYSDQERKELVQNLPAICDQCNKTEILAVRTENDVNALKFAEYMEQLVGQEFDGIVSTVTSFGLFIELNNTIEGFVPIKNIDSNDFYTFDREQLVIVGKNKNKIYSLGTKVRVRVASVNRSKRQIDFAIVHPEVKAEQLANSDSSANSQE